jgi:four helix bundle protein
VRDEGRRRRDIMSIQSYQDLALWKRAMQLVTQVYHLTRHFPREEMHGLTSQMRRAAVSIPTNIAEGWGRGSKKEYIQFLRIARGSLLELETLLTIARNLHYLSQEDMQATLAQVEEISRMLSGLIASLRRGARSKGIRDEG